MGDTDKIDDTDEVMPDDDDLDLTAPTLAEEAAEEQEIWDDIDAEESGEKAADKEVPAAADADDDAADDDDPVVEAKSDDVWADATDAQRAAFEAAQKRGDNAEHAHKSEVGRSKTLRRQLSDVTVQMDRDHAERAAAKPLKDDDSEDKDDPDSWDGLQKEYPEVAGPVNDRLSKIEDAQAKSNREREFEAQDAKEAHKEAVSTQTDLLTENHSDWLEVATTPEFDTWLDDQPRNIRDAAALNASEIVDATAAGNVIARYKASRSDQGKTPDGPDDSQDTTDKSLAARRKRQLDASKGARPRGTGAATQGVPEDGDEQVIWDAIDKKEARAAKA